MIGYEGYKLIHIFGIALLMLALGAACYKAVYDGSAAGRRLIAATHGAALIVILTGGFGLMARLGIVQGTDWPFWIWLKLAIWIILGGATVFIRKSPQVAKAAWIGVPLLAVLAAYLAFTKPGM
jgi:hypothetical protein